MARKNVTSPKRKMASKSRMSKGSKEAKEWNMRMQEAKRRKKEARRRREKKLTSPVKKKSKKKVRFSKNLELPGAHGTTSLIKK